MGRPIEITRFRAFGDGAEGTGGADAQGGAVVRRLLAIALVLQGHPREGGGASRTAWIGRYCVTGCCALQRGRRGRIEFALQPQTPSGAERGADGGASGRMVLEGPPPPPPPDLVRTCGVCTWRCADPQARDRVPLVGQRGRRRTVGKLLRRLHATRLQPRPLSSEERLTRRPRRLTKQNFPSLVAEALPASAAGQASSRSGFQDEARVAQQRSQEYPRAPIGSRPPMVRDNRHDSVCLFRRDLPRAWCLGAAIHHADHQPPRR